jgi:DNA polymerase
VTCLSGAGNPDKAKILIVGDAPSKEEAQSRVSFSDQRGQLLQEALKEAGIPIGSNGAVFATYACKCFPKGKVKTTDARVCCDNYLLDEIIRFKPELILALGKTAQVLLLHNTSPLSKTHGKVFDAEFEFNEEKHTTKVMPVEHPFSVLTSPSKISPWLADISRAKAVLYGEGEPFWTPDKLTRFNFELIDSPRKFIKIAKSLISTYPNGYLALDIEASGLDKDMYTTDFKIFTIQFGIIDLEDREANEALPVYILPLQSESIYYSRATWLDNLVPLLNNFLDPRYFRLVAHNGKYDLKALRRLGVTTPQLYWDTMMLWANAHGEAPMSLKEIAYQVSDLGGYEEIMTAYFKEHQTYDAPPEILIPYGGLDIVVTRFLMHEMGQTVLKETKRDE